MCSVERAIFKSRMVMNESNVTSINDRSSLRGTNGEVRITELVFESGIEESVLLIVFSRDDCHRDQFVCSVSIACSQNLRCACV